MRSGGHKHGAASAGLLVVLAAAIVSAIALAAWPASRPQGKVLWTFADPHFNMYKPMVAQWNTTEQPHITMRLFSLPALDRRIMSSFMAGTPTADLIEVERRVASRTFAGPVESIGFVDLTDRIHAENLLDTINPPSFGPWQNSGRIFGLPHDVHPVMLGYRADLVEAAGIDVSQIETWDDFARLLAPLMADNNGDGQPDRYLLNMWETHEDHLELLLLQAGGGFFDEHDRLAIDSPVNARTLATIVSWCVGPNRIAADAPNFTAAGNKLKADGYVVATFMPDWMCEVIRREIPQLSGKMKLMPLPAFEKGGNRTSVWGGTMLGIPKTAIESEQDFEDLWRFAKHLYFSDELSRVLYQTGGIITPVKSHWTDPIFDQPDSFYSGQAPGRLFINLAPHTPRRSSSPFSKVALDRVKDALVQLSEEARRGNITDRAALEAAAAEKLRRAHTLVAAQIRRNQFHAGALSEADAVEIHEAIDNNGDNQTGIGGPQ